MVNNAKRLYLPYLLAPLAAGILAAVLRTVALLTEYDAAIGFYSAPAFSITVAAIAVLTTLTLAAFTYEKRASFTFSPDYRDLPSLASGVFLAVVLVFFGVTLLLDSFNRPLFILILSALLAACAVAGAFVFVLRGFDGTAAGSARAMLTLPIATFAVLFALYLSFEETMMLNAPPKLLGIATWSSVAFFFLGETRIALERAKWPLHTFITAVTLVLTLTASLPNLIYYLASGEPLLGNTAHDFAALGVFLYALARITAAFRLAIKKAAPATRFVSNGYEAAEPTECNEETANEEATDR